MHARTDDKTYSGPEMCRVADITYRQLDYWARTGLLVPSITPAMGSGSQRLYSEPDVVMARVIRRLLWLGLSLQRVRDMVESGGEFVGLREAVAKGTKRWSWSLLDGTAGAWLDLTSLRTQSVAEDIRLSA